MCMHAYDTVGYDISTWSYSHGTTYTMRVYKVIS